MTQPDGLGIDEEVSQLNVVAGDVLERAEPEHAALVLENEYVACRDLRFRNAELSPAVFEEFRRVTPVRLGSNGELAQKGLLAGSSGPNRLAHAGRRLTDLELSCRRGTATRPPDRLNGRESTTRDVLAAVDRHLQRLVRWRALGVTF